MIKVVSLLGLFGEANQPQVDLVFSAPNSAACFTLSLEFLAWNVVHGKVVHVGLDELEGLLFDHASSLSLKHAVELLDHVAADALPLLASLVECMANDLLHVVESLDTLTHTQAEVAEPLVVECDGPVLAQELDGIWDDAIIVTRGQLVQVVFMEANEAPETLQHNLLVTHVGN